MNRNKFFMSQGTLELFMIMKITNSAYFKVIRIKFKLFAIMRKKRLL
jgi:hypothetical protein